MSLSLKAEVFAIVFLAIDRRSGHLAEGEGTLKSGKFRVVKAI
ncbi:MAG TPA: hypothetical protein VIQ31_10035 [Phormidium sp.]